MAKRLIFTCPKCGEHNVEKVVSCNTASYLLTFMDDEGALMFAEPELDDDAQTECFCCADCGHILADVTDFIELRKYMK